MEIDIAYLIILVVGSFAAYKYGQQAGIGKTLEWMKEQGKIDFDD